MKILPITKEAIKEAVKILKNGGVIAHPADTCYGLAGDFMDDKILRRIQRIKGRDALKPMSIMFHVIQKESLEDYIKIDHFSQKIIDKLLPGPITLIMPKGPKIPKWYFPETNLIGIRIPYEDYTQDILMKFGGPLITTSANLSGEVICNDSECVIDQFAKNKEKPDLILEGAVKNCLPSTVLVVQNKSVKILREGPMTKNQLEKILGINVNNNDNNN